MKKINLIVLLTLTVFVANIANSRFSLKKIKMRILYQ